MFGSGLSVADPVHVRLALHFLHPQGVDNDVDMDVAAVVMSVRVGGCRSGLDVRGTVRYRIALPALVPCPLSAHDRGRLLGQRIGCSDGFSRPPAAGSCHSGD